MILPCNYAGHTDTKSLCERILCFTPGFHWCISQYVTTTTVRGHTGLQGTTHKHIIRDQFSGTTTLYLKVRNRSSSALYLH